MGTDKIKATTDVDWYIAVLADTLDIMKVNIYIIMHIDDF